MVTGCAAQIEPETFAAMPEVARVLGNREKFDSVLPSAQPPDEAEVRVSDIMAVRETAPHLVTGFAERSRAFVEVQNGCDHRCTFCIIPYGRGNSRSVPAGLVVERVKALVGRGLPRSRPDRGRRHQLRPGPARRADARPADRADPPPRARSSAASPVLARLHRDRRAARGAHRRRAALHAAPPHELPGRRRHDPQADEAPPQPRRGGRDGARASRRSGRRSRSAPISSPASRPRPTRWHENSLRLIDECDIVMGHIFPLLAEDGHARGAHAAGAAAESSRNGRGGCARRARGASAAWLEGLVGTRQQRAGRARTACGHAENFAPVRLVSPAGPASIGRAGSQIVECPSITACRRRRLVGTPA